MIARLIHACIANRVLVLVAAAAVDDVFFFGANQEIVAVIAIDRSHRVVSLARSPRCTCGSQVCCTTDTAQ